MNIFGNEDEEPQTENTKVISNSLGIDLGTLNTVIAKPSGDKFDLYQIPSVVAVKKDDPAEVLAVGEEAKKMLGRTPEDILRLLSCLELRRSACIERVHSGRSCGGKIQLYY